MTALYCGVGLADPLVASVSLDRSCKIYSLAQGAKCKQARSAPGCRKDTMWGVLLASKENSTFTQPAQPADILA